MWHFGAEFTMRLYRCLSDFHGSERGIALAIGNFDGFHVGHQAVINAMKDKAQRMGLQSAVMIFEPQPLEFFGKKVPARLFSLRDKLRIFRAYGVDIVFCMSFTRKFAALNDVEFVDLLQNKLNVKSVTVGSQFSFGKSGAYTFTDLERCCHAVGIECSKVHKVEEDGVRISSTLLRSLIQAGDFFTAQKFMGHPYSISGRVVHGNALGRTLGFPTANINLNRRVCPLSGVYAVQVKCVYGEYWGVANVGHRPTVNTTDMLHSLLEVNLIDFNGDLYGKSIEVAFYFKLRDEMKFDGLDALVKQMTADKERAHYLLENMQHYEQVHLA